MVKAAKSLGAGPRQVIFKVMLPSASDDPRGLSPRRGIALLLAVSAEMINATTGIGFLILNSGDLMLTGKLMVGLATLSLLGLASTWALRALEAWLAPWKEEEWIVSRSASIGRSGSPLARSVPVNRDCSSGSERPDLGGRDMTAILVLHGPNPTCSASASRASTGRRRWPTSTRRSRRTRRRVGFEEAGSRITRAR